MPGNGADWPFLDVVETQDLGFQFRGQGHGMVFSDPFEVGDEPVGAEMTYERNPLAADHKNGRARPAAMWFLHTALGLSAVEQVGPEVGNPDASLSLAGRGNAVGERRERDDHASCSDSVARRHARSRHALAAHSRWRSSVGRGRKCCI